MSISRDLYEFIVKIIDDRIRDIKVTREEFDRLVTSVRELVEAQRRAEERVNMLEEALNRLAEAQKRTEERVNELAGYIDKLAKAVYNLRIEVGKLSEAIGFGLEDIARVVLPGWLYRHLGIEVELERRVFIIDGREIEVNLYGVGRRDGERVYIIGEVKSRVYRDDVEYFHNNIFKILKRVIGEGEFIGILFGYLIHPYASDKARELGIYTVASYMR